MTIEEIFSQLSAHMVEGVMIHAQLSDYYNFLGLKGYSKCHEHHYYHEGKNYREVSEYYLTHYNKLIPEVQIPNPDAIPSSWFGNLRQNVSMDVRKNAIKTGFDKWIIWENDTKNLYEDYYNQLVLLGEIATASFVKELVCDVNEELKDAQQLALENKAIDYDICVIMDKQDDLYKKYKHKIKKGE